MLTEKELESLKKQGLYSIGDFAKMFNIKKSVLFYYDHISLFSPNLKNENGYRFYSWEQFDDMVLILMLREIDLPISEIKEYMSNRTPEKFAILLRKISCDIEVELERTFRLQNFVNARMQTTEEALQSSPNIIEIRKFPKEYYYVTKFEGNPQVTDDVYIVEAKHNEALSSEGIFSPYSVGEITLKENVNNGNIIHHSYFHTKLIRKSGYAKNWIRKAGSYLVIYHSDGYWKTPKYHDKLIKYAEEHNYKLGKYFYDEYLLDELSTNAYESYYIRISIEIEQGFA